MEKLTNYVSDCVTCCTILDYSSVVSQNETGMARYSYNVYVEGKLVKQFSSINKVLNGIDIPIEKRFEIAEHFRLQPFEKLKLKEYVDEEMELKIEVQLYS